MKRILLYVLGVVVVICATLGPQMSAANATELHSQQQTEQTSEPGLHEPGSQTGSQPSAVPTIVAKPPQGMSDTEAAVFAQIAWWCSSLVGMGALLLVLTTMKQGGRRNA